MAYSHRPLRSARSNPLLWWVVGIVAAVVVIAAVLYATNHIPFWYRRTAPPVTHTTGNSDTKGEQQNNQSSASDQTPSTPGDNKDTGNTDAGALIAPTGANFVSNHHPSLSNSNMLTSTCTTTPGATCQITFTKDNVTVSLPAETTDAGGSVYWNNWKLQDYNLGVGVWSITAVAKLGTQTLSTSDALQLEVSP